MVIYEIKIHFDCPFFLHTLFLMLLVTFDYFHKINKTQNAP